jgi:hypothetical protein
MFVHTGTFRTDGNPATQPGTETHTFWYSPDAKRWVKREVVQRGSGGGLKQHTVIELVRADVRDGGKPSAGGHGLRRLWRRTARAADRAVGG